MPKKTPGQQGEPGREPSGSGSLPDLSQMSTWHLAPAAPLAEERAKQIAEHKAEADQLLRLMDSIEYGIEALDRRIQAATSAQVRSGLVHSRDDLEQYYEELAATHQAHIEAMRKLRAQE